MKYVLAVLLLAGVASADEHKEWQKMERVLKGLGEGIEALQAIGKHEEAEHLAEIAHDLKRRMAAHRERKAAHDELEVLRLAFTACREAEKGKWAEMLEHAIHARELRLEGERGPEAQRVYRTEPKIEHVIELLMASADLWKEFGHGDKAEKCAHLAAKYREKWQRGREKKGRERDEVAQALRKVLHRMEELEERISRLERHLKRR